MKIMTSRLHHWNLLILSCCKQLKTQILTLGREHKRNKLYRHTDCLIAINSIVYYSPVSRLCPREAQSLKYLLGSNILRPVSLYKASSFSRTLGAPRKASAHFTKPPRNLGKPMPMLDATSMSETLYTSFSSITRHASLTAGSNRGAALVRPRPRLVATGSTTRRRCAASSARPRPTRAARWRSGASPTPPGPNYNTCLGRLRRRTSWPSSCSVTHADTARALALAESRLAGRAGADRRAAGARYPEADAARGLHRSGTTPTPTRCAPSTPRTRDDLDVAALFAEALMNRTPWQLWDLDDRQAGRGRRHRGGDRGARARHRRPGRGAIPACCTCTST